MVALKTLMDAYRLSRTTGKPPVALEFLLGFTEHGTSRDAKATALAELGSVIVNWGYNCRGLDEK